MKMTFFKKATGSPVGDAETGDVLDGKTFQSAAAGPAATGTMPEIGKHDVTPGTSPQSIPEGYHDGTGEVDSLGGDADTGDVLTGKTFSSNTAGRAMSGTMPDRGAVIITPGTVDQAIAAGYHDGTGYVEGDPNLDAGNIKEDVEIFGVVGTLTPASPPVGTADLDDVIKGKTFESAVAGAGAVGTLELTGDAGAGDVLTGKTFYNTNPKSKQTGTLTLSGDAVAANVLSNKTFYNTNPKSKISGSMINRGAVIITPGKTAQNIPAGYHNGSGQVAAVIVLEDSEASDTLKISADTQRSTDQTTYTLLKNIKVARKGSIRVKFDTYSSLYGYSSGKVQIHKNGQPFGTERNAIQTWTTYSEDLNVDAYDQIQLYARNYVDSSYQTSVKNFRIYYDIVQATVSPQDSVITN